MYVKKSMNSKKEIEQFLETSGLELEQMRVLEDDRSKSKMEYCILERAEAFVELGRYDDALLELGKLSSGGLPSVEGHYLYERILEAQPDNEEVLLTVILLNVHKKDTRMLEWLNQALQHDPNNSCFWYLLAEIYKGSDNYNEALDAYGKAIQGETTNISYREARYRFLSDIGKQQEAIEEIDHLLQIDPININALMRKGLIYLENNQYSEAIQVFSIIDKKKLGSRFDDDASVSLKKRSANKIHIDEYRLHYGHALLCSGRETEALNLYALVRTFSKEWKRDIGGLSPWYTIDCEKAAPAIEELAVRTNILSCVEDAVRKSKGNKYAQACYSKLANEFLNVNHDSLINMFQELKCDIRHLLMPKWIETCYNLKHFQKLTTLAAQDYCMGQTLCDEDGDKWFICVHANIYLHDFHVLAIAHANFDAGELRAAVSALRLSSVVSIVTASCKSKEPHCDFPPDWHPKHIQTEMELCDPLFREDSLGELTIDAYAHLRNRKLDLSRGKLDQLESKFGKNYFSCYLRGLIDLETDQLESAVAHFSESLQLEATKEAFYWRGVAHRRLGRFEDARSDLDEAIRLDRKFCHAYLERGHLLIENKLYPEACADFDKVKELRPHLLEKQFTFHDFARLIEEKERAIAAAVIRAKDELMQGFSHKMKNSFPKAINEIELLRDEVGENAHVHNSVMLLRRMEKLAHAINFSFKGGRDELVSDLGCAEGGQKFSGIIASALDNALANLLDESGIYADFSRLYFDLAGKKSARLEYQAMSEKNLDSLVPFMRETMLDVAVEIAPDADWSVGNKHHTLTKLTEIIEELVFNAVKYAGTSPRERRSLRISLAKQSGRLVLNMTNAHDRGDGSLKTSGLGRQIVANTLEPMGVTYEVKETTESYSTKLQFPIEISG